MTRWLIVAFLLGMVGLALVGIRSSSTGKGPSDEILSYELSGGRGVAVGVPAGIPRVFLTSWLVIAPETAHDPTHQYSYGIDIELIGIDGALVSHEREDVVSRVSGEPDSPIELGRFSARLVDSPEWVTDSRSRTVELSALAGKRGSVRVRATGDRPVLVRLVYAEPRSSLARRLRERTLNARERARRVDGRSALGFGDLTADAHDRALGAWGRRLTARGRAGTDFVSRRLLVGDFRADTNDPHVPDPVVIGPERLAVFNANGPLTLRVEAPPRTQIIAVEGTAEPTTQVVGDSGLVDLTLLGAGPRAVRISAAPPVAARFEASLADAARLLGVVPKRPRGTLLEVSPAVLRHRYFALDPTGPVLLDVFPGQDRVGLTVRGVAEGGGRDPLPVELTVKWIGTGPMPIEAVERTNLDRSVIERIGETAVSEPLMALLRVPKGAARLEITGSAATLASFWTREPDVADPLPLPGYDVELGPELTFRYAPRQPRTWATLLPANTGALARAGREVRVEVYPRIDPLRSRAGALAFDRPLQPRGDPLSRRLLTPIWFGAGAPFESHYLTPLYEKPTRVTVPERGLRAGRLAILYRTEAERLGEELTLLAGGEVVAKREILSRNGELQVLLTPGSRELQLVGLGEGGFGLVDAPPTSGGEVFRSQRVVALMPGSEVSFGFDWRAGELGSLRLFFVSEGGPAPYRVGFMIDRGDVGRAESRLLRRITELEGTIGGRTGTRGRGLLWEAGSRPGEGRWSDAVGSARIAIGDDLGPGRHELVLRGLPVQGAAPLWVRGVVVGAFESPAEEAGP
ncbi:MAG: hypothetical protein JW751_16695 [Polyangiaceae bacterium]|nr:hypothetical protein [Polyangiaceae bacterium]